MSRSLLSALPVGTLFVFDDEKENVRLVKEHGENGAVIVAQVWEESRIFPVIFQTVRGDEEVEVIEQ